MTTAPIDRRRALRTALVLTAAFLCVEVVGGILTHSLALLASAKSTAHSILRSGQ